MIGLVCLERLDFKFTIFFIHLGFSKKKKLLINCIQNVIKKNSYIHLMLSRLSKHYLKPEFQIDITYEMLPWKFTKLHQSKHYVVMFRTSIQFIKRRMASRLTTMVCFTYIFYGNVFQIWLFLKIRHWLRLTDMCI